MMVKEQCGYKAPILRIVVFEQNDIVRTSGEDENLISDYDWGLITFVK